MEKKEIIKLLKERLKLEIKVNDARYGISGDIFISLILKGEEKIEDEEISTISFDKYDLDIIKEY